MEKKLLMLLPLVIKQYFGMIEGQISEDVGTRTFISSLQISNFVYEVIYTIMAV